jgi:hypothetical protein
LEGRGSKPESPDAKRLSDKIPVAKQPPESPRGYRAASVAASGPLVRKAPTKTLVAGSSASPPNAPEPLAPSPTIILDGSSAQVAAPVPTPRGGFSAGKTAVGQAPPPAPGPAPARPGKPKFTSTLMNANFLVQEKPPPPPAPEAPAAPPTPEPPVERTVLNLFDAPSPAVSADPNKPTAHADPYAELRKFITDANNRAPRAEDSEAAPPPPPAAAKAKAASPAEKKGKGSWPLLAVGAAAVAGTIYLAYDIVAGMRADPNQMRQTGVRTYRPTERSMTAPAESAAPTATAPPSASSSAPIAPAEASSTPPARPTPGGTGTLQTSGLAPGRRVFLDRRVVGVTPNPITVPCGQHTVQIGSTGKPQTLDVPCGGEVTPSDR